MTRNERASTPVPVDVVDVPESLLKKLNGWKVMLGAVAAIAVLSATAVAWQSSLATKSDVERARAAASSDLDVVRRDTQDLSRRLPVVESGVAGLKDSVTELKRDWEKETYLIRVQLFEITRTVGARQVAPAPAPPDQETP